MPEYAPTAETASADYRIVDDIEGVAALVADLASAGRFALRVITTPDASVRAGIIGMAFATAPGMARYVPVGHRALDSGRQVEPAAALQLLRPVLEDASVGKVGHDLKADMVVLARAGVTLRGLAFDTMLASYLLDASRSVHGLEANAIERLGYKALTEEDLCGRGAKALALEELPPDAVLAFAGERVDLALQLAARQEPELTGGPLEAVYRDLELPLVPVLSELEQAGVKVDGRVLAGLSSRVEGELASRTARIYELAGESFNINSPRQLSEILFDKLQLPASKRTGKTRVASTAVEVLEELALAHELPRLILEWRGLQKLKGTYIDALPQIVEPEHRQGSHLLQPGGGGNRPVEQQRTEPAEHPDPDRARARDPRRLRRRARATSSSRPTTRRSSCACSPTCPETRPSSTHSGGVTISTTRRR